MSAGARAGARATVRRRGIARTLPGIALGVAGLFALAGCAANAGGATGGGHDGHSTTETETEAPAGAGTAADVMFAQMMIPHHEQALEMSGIVLAKAGLDPEVAALAEEIEAAQGPEIAQLEAWLDEWDAPREMPGGGHGMSGMLTGDELAALEAADAATASQLFLEQMIEHHEGAVEMAEEQLASGSHEGAIEMAEAIVATQTAEIERMQALLEG
ncbi:DUF305 domain-containing protein [Agromyces cerinus]|uniref:Uncharacterized conserved protein, DUF305 family n=1 Tax=Agromyces cerinus subsp. cerinus TaxID=232089 RepID=A0A1N6EVW4_9MICO|nr:DUF305 domain-containing protein [Agromyces cerinus]SIN87158.1 Uncharacterized conserved protein, DUF305 family [Agromyces cerinus subsp. cerinus]